jgi:hypothetical protein
MVPRFYFNLHDDLDVLDDEGMEHPNLEAARTHALHCVRVTFAETAKDEGRVTLHHHIDIVDEHGVVLHSVKFGDAVKVDQ